MRKKFALITVLGFIVTASMPLWAETGNLVLYVSQDGNDAWLGTQPAPDSDGENGPLRTLEHARDLVRELERNSDFPGVRIYVRGGDYYLDTPLHFGAQDGGTPEQPVVWSAFDGEAVRLIGGRKVEGWQAQASGIFTAPLPEGVTAEKVKQLFAGAERQTLARWPNKNGEGMPGGDWAFIQGEVPEEHKQSFVFKHERVQGWGDVAGLEVSIWPNYNWWQTIAGVAELDGITGKVRLAAELPYEIKPGRRFFFQNILAELDAPGEWYLDAPARTLHYLPTEGEPTGVHVPALDNVLVLEGTKHLKFIGFTLEICHDHAVVMKDTEECLVGRSTIRNAGGRGVHVEGGRFAQVVGNDISSTGKGGVYLDGGDRKTLATSGHQALNNHIRRFGELHQTYNTGVQIAGVGQRVAHNLIHDGPHIGILLNGNDHVIELNEVYDVCQQAGDNGAFYMGRDWTQRGNVIQYNKFHDVYGFGLATPDARNGVYEYESPHQAWGIYLDDCSSGVTINGNIIYRIPLCGVMIGGGRDNAITNNIIIDCIPALHIDARWDSYPWELMQERLEAMNYKQPPYSERYPELLEMGDDPRRPANNRFESNIIHYQPDDFRGLGSTSLREKSAIVYNLSPFDRESTVINRNIVWHWDKPIRIFWQEYPNGASEVLEWEAWLERGFDNESYVQGAIFVNPERDSYMLVPGGAEYRLPFEELPWEKYGMYKDELRASWPPPAQEQRELPERRTWTVEPGSE